MFVEWSRPIKSKYASFAGINSSRSTQIISEPTVNKFIIGRSDSQFQTQKFSHQFRHHMLSPKYVTKTTKQYKRYDTVVYYFGYMSVISTEYHEKSSSKKCSNDLLTLQRSIKVKSDQLRSSEVKSWEATKFIWMNSLEQNQSRFKDWKSFLNC